MITLHGVRSKKESQIGRPYPLQKSSKQFISLKQKMTEQIEMSKVIAKAVSEAMRIAIQTMAEMQLRMGDSQQGPKIGGPVLKQPQFNWNVADKYTEWKAFILEVKNVLSTYNTPEYDKIAIVKNG